MTLSASRTRAYHRRKRRLSLFNGTEKLDRVHASEPDVGIDTPTLFTNAQRREWIAFSWRMRVAASTSKGLIMEWGNANRGLTVWVNTSGRLGCTAGTVPGVLTPGEQNWTRSVSANNALPYGRIAFVSIACIPARGMIFGSVNGRRVLGSQSSSGHFEPDPNSVWTNVADGHYFESADLTGLVLRNTNVTTPPSGIEALSDLSIFHGQRPMHFWTVPQDDPVGGPF